MAFANSLLMLLRPKELTKALNKTEDFGSVKNFKASSKIVIRAETPKPLLVCVWSYTQIINSTLKPIPVAGIVYLKRNKHRNEKTEIRDSTRIGFAVRFCIVSNLGVQHGLCRV